MVSRPTAAAKSSSARSSPKALTASSTTSNGSVGAPATSRRGFILRSPCGLRTLRPTRRSLSARSGRTRKVTSRPAWASRAPKYPPVAPALTTKMRMAPSPCSIGLRLRRQRRDLFRASCFAHETRHRRDAFVSCDPPSGATTAGGAAPVVISTLTAACIFRYAWCRPRRFRQGAACSNSRADK